MSAPHEFGMARKKNPWRSTGKITTPHTKWTGRPKVLTPDLIVTKYGPLIQKIAKSWSYRFSEYGHSKEDLIQHIYTDVISASKQYDSERASPTTYIHRVATSTMNALMRYHERLKREKQPDEISSQKEFIEPEDRRQPSASMNQREQVRTIFRSIARLKPIERFILIQTIKGKNIVQIGNELGISKQAVSLRLIAIRKKLAGILNEQNFVIAPPGGELRSPKQNKGKKGK